LVQEAVSIAKEQDVVVLMIGLTDSFASQGFDRTHLNIPNNHLVLVEEIAKVNPNIVVCLSNGSPIIMPWKDNVKAILEQYLGGQASGEALVDVLYGKVNPNGKLAETFPNSIDEFPSNKNFPGLPRQVEYREGLYVGYRYYDSVDKNPLFPFGYGLSYTTFEYSDLSVQVKKDIIIKFRIENTGNYDGKEIAQVYISKPDSVVYRPAHELKGYKKVNIKAGESKIVNINISKEDLKVYQDDFLLEDGTYIVHVGASSKDIRLQAECIVKGVVFDNEVNNTYMNISDRFEPTRDQFEEILGKQIPKYPSLRPFTMNSVIGELQGTFVGRKIKGIMTKQFTSMLDDDSDDSFKRMVEAMANELPFRALVMLSGGAMPIGRAEGLLDMMNRKPIRGIYKIVKG